MKRTLSLLFVIISVAASAQEIENVLDTTKTTSREFSFGLQKNSINFNEPLYLLGDLEIKHEQLSKIDPNEINSITVFKEASAVEKYGDRAKFGAVIIEMKKPKLRIQEAPPDNKN
jgi:hypothetical protein